MILVSKWSINDRKGSRALDEANIESDRSHSVPGPNLRSLELTAWALITSLTLSVP